MGWDGRGGVGRFVTMLNAGSEYKYLERGRGGERFGLRG